MYLAVAAVRGEDFGVTGQVCVCVLPAVTQADGGFLTAPSHGADDTAGR
jgi:hypothetical protein